MVLRKPVCCFYVKLNLRICVYTENVNTQVGMWVLFGASEENFARDFSLVNCERKCASFAQTKNKFTQA